VTTSDTATGSASPARLALDDLVQALQRHLAAVEQRAGEADDSVQRAYDDLRDAAERYDDVLFDTFEEVTPWEFAEGPLLDLEQEGEDAAPGLLTLLVRRDYRLDDPHRLLAAGRAAPVPPDQPEDVPVAADETPVEGSDRGDDGVTTPGAALHRLVAAYGVDGFDEHAADAGLTPHGGTVWVQALHPADMALGDDPFDVADPELVVYRLDEREAPAL
jgi:hypothetical protein